MNSKNLAIIVIAIFAVAIASYLLISNISSSNNNVVYEDMPQVSTENTIPVIPSPINISTTSPVAQVAPTYTMAEVSSHNSATSCWTVISEAVYDLTSFTDKHPGGDKGILSLCGKDGTKAFLGQHGGQSKPEQTLSSFKIGYLIR
jgi:cytochrome b involved in lipid metabolism